MGEKLTGYISTKIKGKSERIVPLIENGVFKVHLHKGFILNMRSTVRKDGSIDYQIQSILAKPEPLQNKPEHISHPISRVLKRLFWGRL